MCWILDSCEIVCLRNETSLLKQTSKISKQAVVFGERFINMECKRKVKGKSHL